MKEALTIGGHSYTSRTGFSTDAGDYWGEGLSPLDIANAEALQEALLAYEEDEDTPDVPELPLHEWNARHAVETKTKKELQAWIENPTCSSYRQVDPDDFEVFLTDTPPAVIRCSISGMVYCLEGAHTPMHDLLGSYASHPVIDESLWTEKEQEMTEEAWNEWGYEQIVNDVPGLEDVLCALPYGEESFDAWYWQACSDMGTYPYWSGTDVHFPAIGDRTMGRAGLGLLEELWEWVHEDLWTAVGGKSPNAEAALTLLCLDASCEPYEVLAAAAEQGKAKAGLNVLTDETSEAYTERSAAYAEKTGEPFWKVIRSYNAAPYPEASWQARQLLLTGKVTL